MLRILAVAVVGAFLAAQGHAAPAASETNQWVGSRSCRECHQKFYSLWATSFHGLAMQPYTPALAKEQLNPQQAEIVAGKYKFRADLQKHEVIEAGPQGTRHYPIAHVMGGKNVFYFLTPLDRGRLQVLPVAYDVRRREWFDTTASAMRHFGGDQRDSALYWKDRPLTFNTSCFNCHVSQLSKNYQPGSDTYSTTWAEPGIACETCHGPSGEHVSLFRSLGTNQSAPADLKLVVVRKLGLDQRNDLCGPCHAKMSPVTSKFAPGDRYFDNFDLHAFENRDFYPDGRDLGENYTYTQWRLSPCAKSGKLDCIHCHTSSGRYRFKDPAVANNACLPCHEERVRNATAHTHHKAGQAGNLCVSCHMPMTEFARMRRSDHSMRPPTPATTLAYQSPNACNLCHTNKDAAWADKEVRQWHKRDYQKPVLELAALVDSARKGQWKRLPDMLAYLAKPGREEVFGASLVRLLAGCASEDKWPTIRKLLEDKSPLVRASAAELLGESLSQPNVTALLSALKDDYRLVRVRAASSLAPLPESSVPEGQRPQYQRALAEFLDSLRSRPDDMGSHYNLGNYHMARGNMADAVLEFDFATRLQPDALPPYVNAALAYSSLGQNDKAEASLRSALRLDPTNAPANLNFGMLMAELGKMPEAEKAFRTAFKADPQSAQAAYNLGVLLAKEQTKEGLDWCRRAAELAPGNPQYGYTYAFFLQQAGDLDKALEVLRAVRARHPDHEDSALLEQALLRKAQPKR